MQFEDCLKRGEDMPKEESPYITDYEDFDNKEYGKELEKLSFEQLLARFDQSVDAEGTILSKKDYWNCPIEIRNRLQTAKAENINSAIAVILKKIDKLETKFRKHRHNNTESYGGKAEY